MEDIGTPHDIHRARAHNPGSDTLPDVAWAIAVHGGAGTWETDAHAAATAGVRAAAEVGAERLRGSATALDAAIAAVVALEDDATFNAGTGSTLNLRGEVECDASVMEGHTRRGGAVAAVRGVRNPVLLAREVLSRTDHVLLVGDGAEELARLWGLANGNEPTAARRERWRTAREKLGNGTAPGAMPGLLELLRAHPELGAARRGTVGAVAVDGSGRCAVATSTGGVLLKLPGRVGDTPILGAGSWADAAGAASATGQGELVMRALTTRIACERIAAGADAASAARDAIERTREATGSSDLGLIVVDAAGRLGAAHGTPLMPHAFASASGNVSARLSAESR